jgi:hypothetical protein
MELWCHHGMFVQQLVRSKQINRLELKGHFHFIRQNGEIVVTLLFLPPNVIQNMQLGGPGCRRECLPVLMATPSAWTGLALVIDLVRR